VDVAVGCDGRDSTVVLVVALSAALAAYAVWSRSLSRPRRRMLALSTPVRQQIVDELSDRNGEAARGRTVDRAALKRILATLALAAGVLAVVGGVLGGLAAVVVVVVAPIALSKLEPVAIRREREAAALQVPEAAGLLASCIAAGATVRDAALAVRDSMDDPVKRALTTVVARMDLGAEPGLCWDVDTVAGRELADIATAFRRTGRTGAPVHDVLNRLAGDLANERVRRLEAAARAVGIRVVAPLGLCFLPAFLLIGVVPVVAGFVGVLWTT